MKKIAALLSIIILAVFAQQARALEVQYPQLPFGTLTQNTGTLPEVFQFIFGLALWGAGILLFGGIFYAGFSYITSGASPDKRRKSIRRFGGVLMGAVILFGSFLVLQAINPELTELKNLSFGFCNGPNSLPKDPSLPDCPDIPFFSIGGSSACGNGKIDGAEQCDGFDLNGKTCITQGYSGGTLSCNPGCTLNPSLCVGHISPPCTPNCTPPLNTTYANFANVARSFAVTPFDRYTCGFSSCDPSAPNHRRYINAPPTALKGAPWYGADCGVYVASVVQATIDPNFPDIGTPTQQAYLAANPNFQHIEIGNSSDLQPGDILFPANNGVGAGGHVAIWLDDGTWQASLEEFLPTGPVGWSAMMIEAYRYKGFSS